jgi:hypothetical protein
VLNGLRIDIVGSPLTENLTTLRLSRRVLFVDVGIHVATYWETRPGAVRFKESLLDGGCRGIISSA